MSKVYFDVDAYTARLIGRENVSRLEGAVSELVKNTYDADASCCILYYGNVKKCAVGKHPKSEKLGGIGSGCRLRLRPLLVLHRRQPKRVACIDPDAVVVDKNIAKNDRFDLFSR